MAQSARYVKKLTLTIIVTTFSLAVNAFTFDEVKDDILGISAEKPNSYRNEVFFQ